MKVGLVGCGLVGSTVAIKLYEKGYKVAAVASRTGSKAQSLAGKVNAKAASAAEVAQLSDLLFLGVPDRVIEPLVGELADYFHSGQTVVHFSGALSADVMSSARDNGAFLLSLHPLQSFASIETALETLPGTHFAVEGDNPQLGVKLVCDLGGIPHYLKVEQKSVYHAAASIASNYLVVLADIATKLLTKAGFQAQDGLNAILPLMQGTLTNLSSLGLPQALTGPIARGDYPVVAEHLSVLPEEAGRIYTELGQWAMKVAEAKGTLGDKEKEILNGLFNRVTGMKEVRR